MCVCVCVCNTAHTLAMLTHTHSHTVYDRKSTTSTWLSNASHAKKLKIELKIAKFSAKFLVSTFVLVNRK